MKETLCKSVVTLVILTTGMIGCSNTLAVKADDNQEERVFGQSINEGATWETGSTSSSSLDPDSASAGEGGVPTREPVEAYAGGEYESHESAAGHDGYDSGNGQNLGPGILTAGSFDDGLNLDIFDAFWKSTDLERLKLEVDGVCQERTNSQ